jgi:uncharacterized protein YjbI with pentapeptide repeats
MTNRWTVLVTASLASLLAISAPSPLARADIFQWEYVNPADPSQGKQQSMMLAPDGAGVSAIPGANLSNRNLTKAYLYYKNLAPYSEYDLDGNLIDFHVADLSGVNLSQADLTGMVGAAANLTNADLSQANLTSATFFDVSAVEYGINYSDFTGANLSQANLTNAIFYGAILTGANLSGAEVRGTRFVRYNDSGEITAAQLYSTASYQAHDLTGIYLQNQSLVGINLAGQNLTNARFLGGNLSGANFSQAMLANASFSDAADLTGADFSQANLTNVSFAGYESCGEVTCVPYPGADLSYANLSGADTRGAEFYLAFLAGGNYDNTIWPGGGVGGLDLTSGASLVVRDYDGNPANGPAPIFVYQHAAMDSTGLLRLEFDADQWDSTISFDPGIPVALGGTLELTFAADVNLATQIGRTIDLFDWTGVTPTGAFTISSPYTWDLSQLYTTGEVTLTAVSGLVPGDFNQDGIVDAADYTVWRDGLGSIYAQADYAVWKAHFGETSGSGSAGASPSHAAVPEPNGLALVVLGLPLILWRNTRQRGGSHPLHRRLQFEPLEDRRLLAAFMVGNLNDAGAGSLRQAILDANGMAGADTIEFESVAGTIALTSGEIEITEAVAIDGPGDDVLTIDAGENSRILNITGLTGDVALTGLTLTGGRTTGENVDFYDSTFNGGAIRSLTTGNLTITNCTVSGNSTAGYVAAGGGVYASGDVTLTNSTLSGNHTTGYGALGGGIYTYGNVTLTNSAVSGNSTAGKYAAGGGISTYGAVTLTDSTVSGNQTLGESANGGGVNSFGDVTLNQSAVEGNHTEGINGSGGGIGSQGDVILTNSTVSGNHTLGLTAVGGGIFNFGNVTLSASAVSGNHTEGEGASGGGIRANSSITLLNSTVSGNYTTGLGATGGGVWAGDNVTLTSSIASGNHTGGDYAWGGGSFCYGNLTLTSSTISGNHTAGIFATGAGAFLSQYSALTMTNSILAGNTVVDGGRPDLHMIGSVPPTLHFSLVGNNFGALLLVPAPLGSPDANGNLIGTADNPIDPMLKPLADNGGPTLPDGSKILTQAPLPGSPAINAGDPAAMAGVGGVPFYDQRGTPWSRVGGGRIDIGAVESQSNPLPGDYNFSGVVDAADYTVFRDTLGSTIDLRADGSGNGSVGPEDYGVWKMHFGETLPPGAGSGSLASTAAEFVAPSVERVASGRVASDQVFLASDGDGGRFAGARHFALDAHGWPTIHLRRGASYVVHAISAAAARQDHALLAWVASATRAVPDDGSSDLYCRSTRSPSENLPDCGLGALDAAFGLSNGQ